MRWLVWTVTAIGLALQGVALAQVGGGQLTGLLTDSAGAVVAGATVTAINSATNVARQTVSSTAGVYTVAGLPPGTYRLDVALAGFRSAQRGGIRLDGDPRVIQFAGKLQF